jgi:drug/metabolite transporter (DMT)-like permease
MSVTPILTRALRYGIIVAIAVGVVAGVIGVLVAGVPGLVSGLLGAALAAVFLGLTAVSMLVGGRLAKGDGTNPVFYGVVLGALVLKLIVFLVLALSLRGQTWLSPGVFAFSAIAAVLGSLIGDMVAYARARVPYASDVRLPGDDDGPRRGGHGA